MIISKKKYDDLNNEIIILLTKKEELSNLNIKISNLNEQYKNTIEIKDKKILEISEKYKTANATIGGLSKGNNKLKKDKEQLIKNKKDLSLIISELKKQVKLVKQHNEKLISSNNELMIENNKMIGIIENLNKLVSKKMKSSPTSEQIINYDRKQPSR